MRFCLLLFVSLFLVACQSNPTCPPLPAPYTIQHPAWAAHASIYQVNVRQYTPAGTFRAFEAHLPRLQQMGVGILWLMPVQPIGVEKRKGTLGSPYSIQDYRAVNSELGTMADLQHLIQEAHRLGMHVILDWVANHTSWDSELAQQHPEWFTKDAQGQFVAPVADWQDVIDLDYSKPELRQYMTETMTYWVKTAGFDGFRCDVAGLVPTDFWNDTRRELEKIQPVFMLAEWDELHHPPFLKAGEFTPNTHLLEQAFDATYALRLHYLLDSIAQGKQPVAAIDAYRQAERAKYPAGIYLMNFTSSHDVNSWDGTEYERLGENALAMAVLTTTLPGIPMVYSGQEAGFERRLKFFDKDQIDWNAYPLGDFYTKLLQLKKRSAALTNGDPCATFERLSTPAGVYTFYRQGQTVSTDSATTTPDTPATARRTGSRAPSTATVVVCVNPSDQEQAFGLPQVPAGTYREIFSERTLRLGARSRVSLTPHGYQVYELMEAAAQE
ncbi:alpha-amylase [Hymenobacter sp. NBH84]|uniref:alpha-amylase family glycosyl hydrolase n=1 Tax=Hymenobacter sp. NBH84 TaxID=2596915 RepID=UPI00162780E2|nr:alpha-amylase family glycosyl hydrolase [Hymenobacter sp. NBH84]QNE40167.1 alpha-amylase [Hymenobacter sp. NBH84]